MSFGRIACLFLALSAVFTAVADESIAKALIVRCDLIDDEVVGNELSKQARLAALRCMAGKIGPITYVHHELRKMSNAKQTSDFGTTLSEARIKKLGGPKVFPPTGKYDSITPAGFDAQVKTWIASTKSGDPVACAELGAAAFLDAIPASYGVTEQRIYKFFDKAATLGNIEAKFMRGVCLYYGIGCAHDKQKAFEALKDWKEASGTKKANRGGWIARRFEEMKK